MSNSNGLHWTLTGYASWICPQVGLTAVGIGLERPIVTTQLPSFKEKPPEGDSFCPADSCSLDLMKSYGHWEIPRVLLSHGEAVFGLRVHTVILLINSC